MMSLLKKLLIDNLILFVELPVMLLFSVQLAILVSGCTPVCCKPVGSIEALAGLWDSSTAEQGTASADDGIDVIYTRIMRNGDTLEYDFDGDSVDRGLNCYTIETGSIRHLEGNYFLVNADMHENFSFTVALTLLDDGNRLKVEYLLTPSPVLTDGVEQPPILSHTEIWQRMKTDVLLNNEPACTALR